MILQVDIKLAVIMTATACITPHTSYPHMPHIPAILYTSGHNTDFYPTYLEENWFHSNADIPLILKSTF